MAGLSECARLVARVDASSLPVFGNVSLLPLQDILENEDVKLDNMFVASLVGDIVRVSHVSP